MKTKADMETKRELQTAKAEHSLALKALQVEHAEGNADLHAVLGVLYNLSRSYPEAMAAFTEIKDGLEAVCVRGT